MGKQRRQGDSWTALRDEGGAALLIVVAVLALVAALSIGTWYVRGQSRVLEQTQGSGANLDKIKKAILVYTIRNNRLPCAADGRKAASDSTRGDENCAISTAYEVVPWRTLGIEEGLAIDPWGNRVSYHPSSTPTDLASGTPFASSTPTGGINVYTAYTSGGLPSGSPTVAAYVLISHGADGAGAYTATGTQQTVASLPKAEAENSDNDDDYIKASYDSSATYFDDLVVYDTTSAICSSGSLCTPSQTQEGNDIVFKSSQYTLSNPGHGKSADPTIGKPYWDSLVGGNQKDDLVLSKDGGNRRYCSWYESAFNLKNRKIRGTVDFYFKDNKAQGFVLAFLPGGSTITSGNVPCGASGGYLGFGNDGTYSLNVYGVSSAFGVEVDITQTATSSDPAGNHLAADIYDHSHATNNVGVKHAAPSPTCAGAGCYAGTATWLEDGDTNSHTLRYELDGSTAGQVVIKAWVCRYNTTCGTGFTDLTADYSGSEPSISHTLAISSSFDTLRFGFTSATGTDGSYVVLSNLTMRVYQ
jgi:hypothetical protein